MHQDEAFAHHLEPFPRLSRVIVLLEESTRVERRVEIDAVKAPLVFGAHRAEYTDVVADVQTVGVRGVANRPLSDEGTVAWGVSCVRRTSGDRHGLDPD
jgi:hypothetical protein